MKYSQSGGAYFSSDKNEGDDYFDYSSDTGDNDMRDDSSRDRAFRGDKKDLTDALDFKNDSVSSAKIAQQFQAGDRVRYLKTDEEAEDAEYILIPEPNPRLATGTITDVSNGGITVRILWDKGYESTDTNFRYGVKISQNNKYEVILDDNTGEIQLHKAGCGATLRTGTRGRIESLDADNLEDAILEATEMFYGDQAEERADETGESLDVVLKDYSGYVRVHNCVKQARLAQIQVDDKIQTTKTVEDVPAGQTGLVMRDVYDEKEDMPLYFVRFWDGDRIWLYEDEVRKVGQSATLEDAYNDGVIDGKLDKAHGLPYTVRDWRYAYDNDLRAEYLAGYDDGYRGKIAQEINQGLRDQIEQKIYDAFYPVDDFVINQLTIDRVDPVENGEQGIYGSASVSFKAEVGDYPFGSYPSTATYPSTHEESFDVDFEWQAYIVNNNLEEMDIVSSTEDLEDFDVKFSSQQFQVGDKVKDDKYWYGKKGQVEAITNDGMWVLFTTDPNGKFRHFYTSEEINSLRKRAQQGVTGEDQAFEWALSHGWRETDDIAESCVTCPYFNPIENMEEAGYCNAVKADIGQDVIVSDSETCNLHGENLGKAAQTTLTKPKKKQSRRS